MFSRSAVAMVAIAALVGLAKNAVAQDAAPVAPTAAGLTLDADGDGIIDVIASVVAERYAPAPQRKRIAPEVPQQPPQSRGFAPTPTPEEYARFLREDCKRTAQLGPIEIYRDASSDSYIGNFGDRLCDPLLLVQFERNYDAPVADVATAARKAAQQRKHRHGKAD